MSCLAILNEEGTYPLDDPECTPSLRTSTLKVPPISPLNDVVVHKRLKSPAPESKQITKSGEPIISWHESI